MNISRIKSVIFLTIFFLSSGFLHAQEKDHYQKQIKSIFSTLDTTGLETGLLVDVALVSIENPHLFFQKKYLIAILFPLIKEFHVFIYR
jgi:hypothetical protein